MQLLNTWADDQEYIDSLQRQFQKAEPFPHVIIDNFFKLDIAKEIENAFPPVSDQWNLYNNPIERKLIYDKNLMSMGPEILSNLWNFLQNDVNALLEKITGIKNLESDPHLNGAGFHCHPRGGRLEMHLDYSIHPITNKERRINLIVYMNPYWNADEWNGHLILADKDLGCIKKISPVFNRALIMRTSDESWHGVPDIIACPENYTRNSIAVYYLTDLQDKESVWNRPKARFRPLLGLPPDFQDREEYLKLCEIRDQRRLTKEELPIDWTSTMKDPNQKTIPLAT